MADSALRRAASVGDVIALATALRRGANVDAVEKHDPEDREGFAALHLAAEAGKLDACLALLAAGAAPNMATAAGYTPLMFASMNGHLDIVTALLDARADIRAKTKKKGRTAMYWACARGKLNVLQLLFKRGAALECKSDLGERALLAAAAAGHASIIAALISRGVSLASETVKTPMMLAARNGWHHAVDEILRGMARIDELNLQGRGPDSVTKNITREQLLRVDENGLNVLMIASRAGHARVVRSILQQSHVAESKKGWYVNLRAPDNSSCGNGKTALMFAAAGGHYGACRFLLQAGASPRMRDRNNFTAAMIASMGKNKQVLELLDGVAQRKYLKRGS
eukprot:g4641.t1